MGMDLIGAKLSYQWHTWRYLQQLLQMWGVDISELKNFNDGDFISEQTCKAIGNALNSHIHELSLEDQLLFIPDIPRWLKCKGGSQY